MSKAQSGYVALLSVLIIGAVALAIASALLVNGADSQREVLTYQQSVQARALATACTEEALQQMHDNTAFTGTNNLTLGQGNCTYTVTNTGGTARTIASSGTVSPVVRKIFVNATAGATAITITSWQDVPTLSTPATIAFVQVNSATPQTNQSSVATTYTSAQTAGNTNIVAFGWEDTTSTITSVTDTMGNSYQVAAPRFTGNGFSQAIYYAKNIASAPAGTNIVTVNFSAAAPFVDARILEYSGIDQASPFDATTAASGSGTTASTSNVTTAAPSELIFSAGMTITSYTGAGTNFTSRKITSPNGDIVQDRFVSSAGAYNATAPLSSSGNWLMQIATFKAAGQ